MSKLFASLFMVSLQLTLGLSWYFGYEDGITLSTLTYGLLMTLIFLFFFVTAIQVSSFDDDSLTDEGVKDFFKRCDKVDSVWFTAYSMASLVVSLLLLSIAISPALAVIYFWLSLVRMSLRYAILKRYKKHMANK